MLHKRPPRSAALGFEGSQPLVHVPETASTDENGQQIMLRSPEFMELTETEYSEYIRNRRDAFYTQLPTYAHTRSDEGQKAVYVGLVDDDGVKAAALVTFQPWRKFFLRASIPYGPTLDWDNEELVERFMHELKVYLRRDPRVIALRFNPLVREARYADIKRLEPCPEAARVKEIVGRVGGIHVQRDYFDGGDIQIRWVYVKNIEGSSFDQVTASCKQAVRTRVSSPPDEGIEVKFLGVDEFDVFRNVMDSTVERTGMPALHESTYTYYRDLLEHCGPEVVMIPAAILHCDQFAAGMQTKIAAIDSELAALEELEEQKLAIGKTLSKKQHLRQAELSSDREIFERRRREALEVQATHGDTVPLAASYFVATPHEFIYLCSGACREYQGFGGVYAIHREMLMHATERGVDRYNFFGISGDFSKNASDAGVLDFKRQFRGDVEEYIGTFDVPIRKFLARKTAAIG
ncbi:peptidoglycan bridge formation glycyltransferase FemA/FemB family protein [Changpingibacter yushuensis]|uniref:peptidoglycan bridge formation glycyltransferase FemA/FemB family protein n=1 Tax=Changpingibacter yushuensis TaxID=2758440 RepID=UPI00165EA29E|nr:peptidoglycan bridge formation glycyltransferase FemA/FemB family protein [Changpingibacter yushuensis]